MASEGAIRFAAASRVLTTANRLIRGDTKPDERALSALHDALTRATIVLPKAAADICRSWLTESRSHSDAIAATRRYCDQFRVALREHFTDR
jgi:hypothetical protein